jgi:hypothetical protein
MKEDSHRVLAETPPLRRDMRTPGAWEYLLNYLLLGSSAILILMQIIETGVWRKLWLPLLLTCLAMFNIARLRAAERKVAELGAPPNGGPAASIGNSEVSNGPPSVS